MNGSTWVLDNEPRIYTIIKAKTEAGLKKKYPKIYYTTSDELSVNETKPQTVYIHEVSAVEVGQDTDAKSINGVLSTFEVRVTATTQKSDARTIIKEIVGAFKELRFEVVALPEIMTVSGMYQASGRFRRIIGADDTL